MRNIVIVAIYDFLADNIMIFRIKFKFIHFYEYVTIVSFDQRKFFHVVCKKTCIKCYFSQLDSSDFPQVL